MQNKYYKIYIVVQMLVNIIKICSYFKFLNQIDNIFRDDL